MSNTDGEYLGDLGSSTSIGATFLRATASDVWGINLQAYKRPSSQRVEKRNFTTSGPAHQLVRILSVYAEQSQRHALEVGHVLERLENLVTTIKLAQEAAHLETEAFRAQLAKQ